MQEDTRILFVDDEKVILETFSMMIQDLGYYVRTASTPHEAIKLITEDKFNIVFMDQFLKSARGLDLMGQMKQIDPEIYFAIMTANGSSSLAVESLKKGASDFIVKPFFIADVIKSIDYVNKKRGVDKERKEILSTLQEMLDEKTDELNNIYVSVLSSLAQAMEKKDMGTYGHCKRVSHYSRLIAADIDLNEKDKYDLKTAAMLHDIGKIGISDFVLGKKGPLDCDEMNIIRNHPSKGVEILKPIRQFKSILPAILHHHENYDGSGYPAGLSGENIPLLGRIIAVADTYDAILSNRPYRAAADRRKAFDELLKNAGTQFDGKIVHAFVNADTKYAQLFNVI